jgi:hypothetical protein
LRRVVVAEILTTIGLPIVAMARGRRGRGGKGTSRRLLGLSPLALLAVVAMCGIIMVTAALVVLDAVGGGEAESMTTIAVPALNEARTVAEANYGRAGYVTDPRELARRTHAALGSDGLVKDAIRMRSSRLWFTEFDGNGGCRVLSAATPNWRACVQVCACPKPGRPRGRGRAQGSQLSPGWAGRRDYGLTCSLARPAHTARPAAHFS